MANALYDNGRERFLGGAEQHNWSTDDIKCALVSAGYVVNLASHAYYADITPGSNEVADDAGNFTAKTITGGTADAGDITFTAVTGAQVTQMVTRYDSGVDATSSLMVYHDTAGGSPGLPVTPNGTDIDVLWNVAGIFTL